MNTIAEFISSFHSFESCHSLFLMRDRYHRPWWDLIRYRVQFLLLTEYGLHPSRSTGKQTLCSLLKSFLSLCRQSLRLTRDILVLLLSDTRSLRVLVVSNRDIDYIDNLKSSDLKNTGILSINKSGSLTGSLPVIKYQSIQFFVRVFTPFVWLPSSIKREAALLSNELAATFAFRGDILGIIIRKLREEESARFIWRFILSSANALEKVVYINDDSLKSLVFEARLKGIETEEVQHAYMGKEHIAFSYPSLSHEILTLPDKVVITRDTHDIIYPATKIIFKQASRSSFVLDRDIDILVGSSQSFIEVTSAIVQLLGQQPYRLAVKLHPAEPTRNIDIYRRSSNTKSLLIYDGNKAFCDIACRSKIFIPANPGSTAAFDAADVGAKVIFFHRDGVKTTGVGDSVATAHVFTLVELLSAVEEYLPCNDDENCIASRKSK